MIRSLPRRRVRSLAAVGLLLATCGLAGCWNPFSPLLAPGGGIPEEIPVPNSAANVLKLFEWCYNHKAADVYRELFTDDYRFVFSPLDSAGQQYRQTPWTREDELISTTQLFVGGSADQPPASSISLNLDRNFHVLPDPRYTAWDLLGRWHKNIKTTVVLNIRTSEGSAIDVTGSANFFLVRGDSALIPEELRLRGFGPDTTRWYIQRWEDETAQAGGVSMAAAQTDPAALPARRVVADGGTVAATRIALAQGPNRPIAARPAGAAEFFDVSWGTVKVYWRPVTTAR